MRYTLELKVPSKVIISGEFSCIFGHSVVTCPVPLYLNLSLVVRSPRADARNVRIFNNVFEDFSYASDALEGCLEDLQKAKEEFYQFKVVFAKLSRYLGIDGQLNDLSVDFRYHSQVPIGMGLGSSASFILSIYYSCLFVQKILGLEVEQQIGEETFEFLRDLENLFHGKSSGIDLLSIIHGKIGIFKRSSEKWVLEASADNLKESLRLMLVDSKQRKNTKESVEFLLEALKNNPDLHDKLSDINSLTLKIFESIDKGAYNNDFHGYLNQNHKALKDLQLSSVALDEICSVFEKFGVGCKMTGGGRGGYCIALFCEHQAEPYGFVKNELEARGFVVTEFKMDTLPKIVINSVETEDL